MAKPAKHNIQIYQGATLNELVTWKTGTPSAAVNLTGCTARMQVREKPTSPSTLIEFTTENGGIVLGGSAGTINIKATATQTSALTWKSGVYDLEVAFPDATVRRLMAGSVSVSPEVTR